MNLVETVSTILSGAPVKIFDEESYSVIENELWELVTPRTSGDYRHTRIIGSANIALAFNIVHQSIILDRLQTTPTSDSLQECSKSFSDILQILQQQKLIRKKPHRVRQSFKLISNE